MTLTIELTPAEEVRLRERAAQEGVEPETMAVELIRRKLLSLSAAKSEDVGSPKRENREPIHGQAVGS